MDAFDRTIETRYGEMKGGVSRWATRQHARWSGSFEGYEESKPTG
jgi:hypothetical protein